MEKEKKKSEKKRVNRIIMRPIILHTHIPAAFRVNQRASQSNPARPSPSPPRPLLV